MDLAEMQQRLLELEARVRATEDLEAIKQLQYRYKNAFMQAQWDIVLDCFAEDAVISIDPSGEQVGKGIAAIRHQYGRMAEVHVGAETDFMYHPIITVEGDTAHATWMVTDTMHIVDQPHRWIYGMYVAEYARVDGEWKISYLAHRHREVKPAPDLGPPRP